MDEKQVEKLLDTVAKIPEKGGLFPRESIRAAAIAELSKPPRWKRMLNYKIPVYQPAAALLLFFIGLAGTTFLAPHKKETVVIQQTQPGEVVVIRQSPPYDCGLIQSSTVKLGMSVRQDRLKKLCDSLLL